MREKLKIAIATTLITTMLVSIGYAIIHFTLTVPNTMKLNVGYGLELWNDDGGLPHEIVTQIEWETFEKGMFRNMNFFLKNTGDVSENVVWSANVPAEWELKIFDEINVWNSGTPKTIGAGDYQKLFLQLTEISAVLGVTYTFDLTFEVTD